MTFLPDLGYNKTMRHHLPERVHRKLQELPNAPGCYLMQDGRGRVLYVGKAVVLRHRVRSYFQPSARHTPRIQEMVEKVRDITWWVTRTELEALVLENDLIKRYQPRYNVMLKDDKHYPYIKIRWQDDFPKVERVRRMEDDGARYFGPFASSRAVTQTLDALRRIFPYLDCNRTITGQDPRACLYYHLKLCGGPCIGAQSREEYREVIQGLMDFLEGRTEEVMAQLQARMEQAAEELRFEQAALYRDRIRAVQRIVEQQQVVGTFRDDEDVVAIAQDPRSGDTVVQVLFVRKGRLVGREDFVLQGAEVAESGGETLGDLVGIFIQRFYHAAAVIPPRILVQYLPDNAALLAQWLRTRRGKAVELRMPQRGKKRRLMELAIQNAQEALRVQQAEWAADAHRQTLALTQLQEALELAHPPSRIECFDVSTLQGTHTVASMVVFVQGVPQKSAYRRFKVRGRGAHGVPDDLASMREALHRRFRRAVEGPAEAPGTRGRRQDAPWRLLPDLLMVDGGPGQLQVAMEVLEDLGLEDRVPVVALAKRREELYLPGRSTALCLPRGSQALYLIQRIRDEAHRFAVTYHRSLRRKEQVRSALDRVPGIGPARRKALLQYFGGDVERIRQASLEELLAVPGMNRKAAEAIRAHL